jgi:hypothetical protein
MFSFKVAVIQHNDQSGNDDGDGNEDYHWQAHFCSSYNRLMNTQGDNSLAPFFSKRESPTRQTEKHGLPSRRDFLEQKFIRKFPARSIDHITGMGNGFAFGRTPVDPGGIFREIYRVNDTPRGWRTYWMSLAHLKPRSTNAAFGARCMRLAARNITLIES